MQYGFQRLVLLGSGKYSRAELPLDGSVSLIAPNNIGKTSLINALQFLLIIDRRRMDFGAHSVDASRRFYFPNNSAYILLEVSLPEVGTVVLGCVGKGVSYDYEYFAYEGSLNIEEFCLPNGNLVAQPQLNTHLAQYGRRLFTYDSREFAQMVYGRQKTSSMNQQNFRVFRLENASDASVFQTILTRTLHLDKLTSKDVKKYLLDIFRRDLPDATINFKEAWDKAFADVNAERAQYQAAVRLQDTLKTLENKCEERKILRGKILYWQPLIDQALNNWHQYYEEEKQNLQNALIEHEVALRQQRENDLQAARLQTQLKSEHGQLQQQQQQLDALRNRFTLISNKSMLQSRREALVKKRDELVVRIGQVQSTPLKVIESEIQRLQQELRQLEREMTTQGQNLYHHLSLHLPAEQLSALNKVLSKSILTSGTDIFELDECTLLEVLKGSTAQSLCLPGLSLNVSQLSEQHQQQSMVQLQQRQQELNQQLQNWTSQLETAQELAFFQNERSTLEQQINDLDADLQAYQVMETLEQSEEPRCQKLSELAIQIQELEHQLTQSEEHNQALYQRRQEIEQQQQTLTYQHRQITTRKEQRIDQEAPLIWIKDSLYHPWLVQTDFGLNELAEYLKIYLDDCKKVLDLNQQIQHLMHEIHIAGLTKYQWDENTDTQIEKLIAFSHCLPKEAEALEKKARSAVINVTASLRELRGGLLAFKHRMKEFNQKISGRKLSDLEVFKIEAEDHAPLVEAIELLIATANTVETGEVFDLFDHSSILDDVQINRAKNLLVAEGNARDGLRVADLFHLRFKVGKANQQPESFDDIDSAASNGTVLMAKLVTGLAMLHLMQDHRRPIQSVCYLDEALALDARNQRNLIAIASEFGFSLVFASPAPLTTVRYCVPIHQKNGQNQISRLSWQIIESVETKA